MTDTQSLEQIKEGIETTVYQMDPRKLHGALIDALMEVQQLHSFNAYLESQLKKAVGVNDA